MLQVMCSWSPMFTHPVLQFLFISFCAIQCTAHVCCTGSMIYAWCIVYKAKFFLWRAHKCTAPLAGWHGACLALIPILRLIDPTPTHRSPHTPNLPPPWWCNQAWTLPRLAHALQCIAMAMKEWAILISWLECPMWPPLHWLEQNIIYSSWNQI